MVNMKIKWIIALIIVGLIVMGLLFQKNKDIGSPLMKVDIVYEESIQENAESNETVKNDFILNVSSAEEVELEIKDTETSEDSIMLSSPVYKVYVQDLIADVKQENANIQKCNSEVFQAMPYDLFVSIMPEIYNSEVSCSDVYYEYGILSFPSVDNWYAATQNYADFCKEQIGLEYEVIQGYLEEDDKKRLDREYKNCIMDISEDRAYILTGEKQGNDFLNIQVYSGKNRMFSYENMPIARWLLANGQRFGTVMDHGYYDFMKDIASVEKKTGGILNDTGELGCASKEQMLHIFDVQQDKVLFSFELSDFKADYLCVTQFKGNRDAGFIIFNDYKSTYKLTYPEGGISKVGDYIYNCLYSPDEKYLVYTSPESYMTQIYEADDAMQFCETVSSIPVGIYVQNLETMETVFVDFGNPDLFVEEYSFRWLEKKKEE